MFTLEYDSPSSITACGDKPRRTPCKKRNRIRREGAGPLGASQWARQSQASTALCIADATQLGANIAMNLAGVSAVKYLLSGAKVLRGGAAGVSAANAFATNAAVLPAAMAVRTGGHNGRGGSSNPLSGSLATLYTLAKSAPLVGVAIDAYEAATSCMNAAGMSP